MIINSSILAWPAALSLLTLTGCLSGGSQKVAKQSESTCVSTTFNGDGWDWKNAQRCKIDAQPPPQGPDASATAKPKQLDMPFCNSLVADPDGDGFGWENGMSCRGVAHTLGVYGIDRMSLTGDSVEQNGVAHLNSGGIEWVVDIKQEGVYELRITYIEKAARVTNNLYIDEKVQPLVTGYTDDGNGMRLSNPQASPEAVTLFQYLNDIYGSKTLTGQQESTWKKDGPRHELDYLKRHTGKLPAMLGLDYIDPKDYDGVNRRAANWYKNENGIPTICWHWGAPNIGTGYENSKKYFDLPAALIDGTAENLAMMRDMDEIATHLAVLRDQGVPVLWRPLHEFTGEWFWWGMHGSENFKRLWVKMYNYFTHEKGLNNLIWVLGYAAESSASYYPGDDYVDIAGLDTYVNHHGALKDLYHRVKNITGSVRPIVLHENGPVPDPALIEKENADWLWFMTWHTDWLTDEASNPRDFLRYAYNHERFITKDELPDLAHYTGGARGSQDAERIMVVRANLTKGIHRMGIKARDGDLRVSQLRVDYIKPQ